MHFYNIIHNDENKGVKRVDVDTITCDIYINKYLSDLNDFQLQRIKEELYGEPKDYLCPDIDTIYI